MFVVAFRITISEKDHEIKRTPGGTATGMTAKVGGQQVRTSSMVLLVAYAFYRLNVF